MNNEHQLKTIFILLQGEGDYLKQNGMSTPEANKTNGKAATYSRASYTCTTIGNAAFDGRVRDGIGSDHSFIATKK
jgi:hypothetical protein